MLTVAKANKAGVQVAPVASDPPVDAPSSAPGLPPLAFGQVPTLALAALWSGDPAVVVKAPPGSGKSRTLAIVTSHLQVRADLRVGVACQTTTQAYDLAVRIAQMAPAATVTLVGASGRRRPTQLPDTVRWASSIQSSPKPGIYVTTSAKLRWNRSDTPPFDLLAVDEAWQITWADLQTIASLAPQLVAVGDPGQIEPVVPGDTSRWVAYPDGPDRPGPVGLLHTRPDHVTLLTLPDTWRLGPATTAVVRPFYDFTFGTRRPDRTITTAAGTLPELGVVTVPPAGKNTDPALLAAVEGQVRTLLAGGTYHDESGAARPLVPSDVGVVVPNRVQVASLTARLSDLPDVTVATANSHQGAEYLATVVMSPLAGVPVFDPSFHLDLGRLCVSLSRHVAHATVVRDAAEDERFARQSDDATVRQRQVFGTVSDLLTPIGGHDVHPS